MLVRHGFEQQDVKHAVVGSVLKHTSAQIASRSSCREPRTQPGHQELVFFRHPRPSRLNQIRVRARQARTRQIPHGIMESAAPDLVEDIEVAMVVQEGLYDADTPESKRRRTTGGHGPQCVIESGVCLCSVRCRAMVGGGRQFECDSMSRSECVPQSPCEWFVRRVVLVAQEFATDVRYGTFANAPPLKAVKLGLIQARADFGRNQS